MLNHWDWVCHVPDGRDVGFLSFCLGGMVIFGLLLGMSMTHQTTIIVYRFTETLAEEYSWKPQEAAAASFLKWSAIILLPIVGVLILMDPSLVIAGIGPLGMGLIAWMMGTQQAKQNKSQHKEVKWTEAEEIVAWRKRNLIGLRFTDIHEGGIETFFIAPFIVSRIILTKISNT